MVLSSPLLGPHSAPAPAHFSLEQTAFACPAQISSTRFISGPVQLSQETLNKLSFLQPQTQLSPFKYNYAELSLTHLEHYISVQIHPGASLMHQIDIFNFYQVAGTAPNSLHTHLQFEQYSMKSTAGVKVPCSRVP